MFIIKNTKLFLSIAGILVAAAVGVVAVFGLQLGIDFTGGTIIEVSYTHQEPPQKQVESAIEGVVDGGFSVRPTGEAGYTIRTPFLEEEERENLISALSTENGEVVQERLSSIGPTIGTELARNALWAIAIVIGAIILFVAFSFRRGVDEEGNPLQQGVSSWFYGLAAIAALVFDIAIPTGMFAVLGQFTVAEVDILFVTALLAILGFSVNDTIVVFDRIRENLQLNKEKNTKESFAEAVGRSLEQTFTRSINTSLTTLIVLLALFTLGGSTTQFFALTLLVGVVAGTYSSLFLASPLLVQIEKWMN